tara:strand:- start:4953 stop:5531 length:579 start_codon:yes stop_codon:yes gene_type:complete
LYHCGNQFPVDPAVVGFHAFDAAIGSVHAGAGEPGANDHSSPSIDTPAVALRESLGAEDVTKIPAAADAADNSIDAAPDAITVKLNVPDALADIAAEPDTVLTLVPFSCAVPTALTRASNGRTRTNADVPVETALTDADMLCTLAASDCAVTATLTLAAIDLILVGAAVADTDVAADPPVTFTSSDRLSRGP